LGDFDFAPFIGCNASVQAAANVIQAGNALSLQGAGSVLPVMLSETSSSRGRKSVSTHNGMATAAAADAIELKSGSLRVQL